MAKAERYPLAPEVRSTLSRLRRQIRQYVFWEGMALLITLAGLLFWGSFIADAAYFGLSRLELPAWLRAAVLVASASLLSGGIVWLLVFPTVRRLRNRSLALLLERRFPQLGDGLITAVEASEGAWTPQGELESALLARTLSDAARRVENLDSSHVFDRRPLRRTIIAATVLVVSILGLCVVDSAAMERWIDGYVRLQPAYWPRQTELIVQVRVSPGDVIRDFVDGHYQHPRGGDLQLQINTLEGKKAPDRVRLDYRLRNGSWKRTYLTATGDQPFQHSFAGLLDSLEFWVSGGDYASSSPWRVDVVDPPRLDQVNLSVLYPEYTGLNARSDTGISERAILPVQGSQITLPLGTSVEFQGVANKPLIGLRMEIEANGERFEWQVRRQGNGESNGSGPMTGTLLVRATEDELQQQAELHPQTLAQMFSTDGKLLTFPFYLDPAGAAGLRERLATAVAAKESLPAVVPWPADSQIRLYLEDTDGIISADPLRLTINGLVDQPPVITVELKGVSNAITRQARIPVAGTIVDDYGVKEVRFDYLIDAETEWKPQLFPQQLTSLQKDVTLARSATEDYERFDVLPLDLSLKQKLTLVVTAADGNTLTGPGEQRSQKFVFTVVSVEELLSLLYAKELNLRKRFEQLLSELKGLQQDLQQHREKAAEWEGSMGEARRSLDAALSACAERSLSGVRKNSSELQAIEAEFAEIRNELVNNAAETPQNMARLESKILGPLSNATTTDFPATDAALGLFSLATQRAQNPTAAIEQSEQELGKLIAGLERVLLEMRKLATVQEALELLKSIIADHDKLTEETKTQRKQRALRALEE